MRTDDAGGSKKVSHYLYKRAFAYSLGIRVNERISELVPTLREAVKQRVLRPGAAGGVTDTDTA